MRARDIRALDCWGAQGGLLSTRELEELMALMGDETKEPMRVLEIGHYFGLSTCGIVHALRDNLSSWSLTTVDAHIPDRHVPVPAGIATFRKNMGRHFADPRVKVVHGNSEELKALDFDVVFYDGNHYGEQLRFASMAIHSPSVRLFIFDDSDIAWGPETCDMLKSAGWQNCSPKGYRNKDDKANSETMTLGVFRRAN